MARVAIFASGEGTNAEAIIRHLQKEGVHSVTLLLTNRPDAGVIKRAEALGVPVTVFDRNELTDPKKVLQTLMDAGVNLVVLAGFLWLMPLHLVQAFDGAMLNIHPALLPRFGGKGMYGMHVHRAVKDTGETETGISIHLVSAEYDRGRIIFQARCPVAATDTPEDIGSKVRALELCHYPMVISQFLG
jgi:phosphoribosylglycinamide formyltransferase-1